MIHICDPKLEKIPPILPHISKFDDLVLLDWLNGRVVGNIDRVALCLAGFVLSMLFACIFEIYLYGLGWSSFILPSTLV